MLSLFQLIETNHYYLFSPCSTNPGLRLTAQSKLAPAGDSKTPNLPVKASCWNHSASERATMYYLSSVAVAEVLMGMGGNRRTTETQNNAFVLASNLIRSMNTRVSHSCRVDDGLMNE